MLLSSFELFRAREMIQQQLMMEQPMMMMWPMWWLGPMRQHLMWRVEQQQQQPMMMMRSMKHLRRSRTFCDWEIEEFVTGKLNKWTWFGMISHAVWPLVFMPFSNSRKASDCSDFLFILHQPDNQRQKICQPSSSATN